MARTIVHIPAQPRATTVSATENTRLRTAAYCRVSTEQEEQLNSYEAQVDYYTHYIKTNPKYILWGFTLIEVSRAPTPAIEMTLTG